MAVVHSEAAIGAPRTFPNGVVVRCMTASDCDFAGRLIVEGFQSKFEHIVGQSNLKNITQATVEMHRKLGHRYNRIFIAEVEGRPAGLLELKFHGERTDCDDEPYRRHLGCWPLCRLACSEWIFNESVPRDRCYVDHIVVDGNFRGKGIGKSLLQVADEEAKMNNCQYIFLWVADDNRAKNLYEREGYTVSAREGGCIIKFTTGKNRFLKMEKRLGKW